jgi:hypothetical protein
MVSLSSPPHGGLVEHKDIKALWQLFFGDWEEFQTNHLLWA